MPFQKQPEAIFEIAVVPYRNACTYNPAMRDLDLTTLRLFVAVCETQNIARAGEQQHIVASAISKRLAQLEETVGTSLLDRAADAVWYPPPQEKLC